MIKKLRIAQIAPIAESVPPKKYGGTERVVSALTEELVKRGHDVTLFASGNSKTSAKLKAVFPKSLREIRLAELYGGNILTMLHIGFVYQMQSQFDIIHDHFGYLSLPTANLSTTPVVMTMHGNITIDTKRIFENLKNPNLVAISKSQMVPAPHLNWKGVVYNGLDMQHYPFSDTPEEYLLFVGRISREKGLHYAIEVAQYLDMPLIIAAKLNSFTEAPFDVQYFREYIEPRLSDSICWVGEVDEEERNKLMHKALCLLHPVTWREPFGLNMIEAMACGCPVVGFNLGSIPEVVQDLKTGYVVSDLDEMIQAVSNIKKINRKFCRKYALEKFSVTNMTDGYESLYYHILGVEE